MSNSPPPPPGNFPPPPGRFPAPARPTNGALLAGSIIATLLCCLPAGIVAIVYATKGEDDKAKMWIVISAVLGLVGGAIVLGLRGGS